MIFRRKAKNEDPETTETDAAVEETAEPRAEGPFDSRQGVALGLIGMVVGEMVGSSQGVGFMVAYGGQTFNTDTLFVGMIVIAFSGILLTWLAERLERRFSRWRPER